MHFGDVTGTVQGTYGKTSPNFPSGEVTGKDLWSLSFTAVQGAATVHVAYLRTQLTIDSLQPLFDGFRQFGPEGVALADKYEPTDTLYSFITVGGMYDPGDWFVMGEWGHANAIRPLAAGPPGTRAPGTALAHSRHFSLMRGRSRTATPPTRG
jgi:hypothetical protein